MSQRRSVGSHLADAVLFERLLDEGNELCADTALSSTRFIVSALAVVEAATLHTGVVYRRRSAIA